MKDQIRMIVAEKLLGWVVSIVPKNDEGMILVYYIKKYFEFVVSRNKEK